jgi:hypothetical protein
MEPQKNSAENAIHFRHRFDHRTPTFQQEYRELLRRYGVDFDERYVWD